MFSKSIKYFWKIIASSDKLGQILQMCLHAYLLHY